MIDRAAVQLLTEGTLFLLLLMASVADLRTRRIPNQLVATILVVGILITTAFDPVLPGLLRAVVGAGIGLLIWLPGWLLRMMGAGDVKLFAAAGAWLGPNGAVNAAIFTALAGGLLSVIWMLVRRGPIGTRRTFWVAAVAPRTLVRARLDTENLRDQIPYSVAIMVGVVAQLALPGLVVG